MKKWVFGFLGIFLLMVLGVACRPMTLVEREGTKAAYNVAPEQLARPTAPAAIDGDWRRDKGQQLKNSAIQNPILVFVFSDFCGTCLAMRPAIVELEQRYWGQLEVVYLDREDDYNNYEAILGYDIRSQPEFLLLASDKTLLQKWQGAPPIEDLENAIQAVLALN